MSGLQVETTRDGIQWTVRGRRNPYSVASLACSLIALPWLIALYVEFLNIVPAILGIVLGAVAQRQIRRSDGTELRLRVSAAGNAIGVVVATFAIDFTVELVNFL